jgi:hypothetical protein
VGYHELSVEAQAVCSTAIQAELEQLGVNHAEDQQLLAAFQQLPHKQKELLELQQDVKRLADLCSKLATEAEQHQQREEEEEQQQPGAPGGKHSLVLTDDASASSKQHSLSEQQQLLADAQQRQQALMELVHELVSSTSKSKHVAIAYRFEKHKLLKSILQKLQ